MNADERELLSTTPKKTVRFGGRVTDMLDKHQLGDHTDYELIKHQLMDPDIKDAQIVHWLQELRSCVTRLTKEHEHIVYSALRLPWADRSQAVVDEYLSFLSNLVTAQTVFLRVCLRTLVSLFVPKRVTICEGGVDVSDSDDEDENLPRTFERCHQALQLISRYVPSTSRFLKPILHENFPFTQKSCRTLECYVHNLLRVSVYLPVLRRDILELIISKMLKLDVSVSRDDIEEAEEENMMQRTDGQREEGLFDMDEDTPPEEPSSSALTAHPEAQKLDALMSVMMAYIKDVCYAEGSLQVEHTKALYRELLSVFDRVILTTHASCHVQFLLFYLCSYRLALAEAFLDHLWRVLQNPSQPSVLRQAAAAYLGSFLARAKFIPVHTVRACLDLLLSWIHTYIDGRGGGSAACCDITVHGPFYAACQASFYTLVFRHRALLDADMRTGLEYLQRLNLERVVLSQLNPLKVCLPSITNMFAAITRKYQLVFCYSIMEQNNRAMLPVVHSSRGGHGGATGHHSNPLDTYFPFDPYVLRRSGQLIEPLYQKWEELSDVELLPSSKGIQASKDDEDDFLHDETPQTECIMGMTPSSVDSTLQSPTGRGSPRTSLHPPF